jgi:HPt (histidine-containing phosphotransfer) domain-containing protein
MANLGAKARERAHGELPVVAERPPPEPRDPAIDRAHLARMTHGERDLEREVLRLFATQADVLLERMREAPPAAIRALAHTLAGSAQSIGAWRLAEAAAAVEQASAYGTETAPAVERLAAAARAAQVEIAALVGA